MPRLKLPTTSPDGAAICVDSRVLVCVFKSSIDEPCEGRFDVYHDLPRNILARTLS
jgi:hypothetical protein